MKAIIPVAGAGTKLRPLTYTQPKPLIPVAGKPILAFIIDQLIDQGINEYIFVLGYLGDKIRTFVEDKYPDISSEFVYQNERMGLGHAVWMCRDLIESKDDLIIFLGDTIVLADIKKFIHYPHSCLAVKKVDDPRQFGVVEIKDEGLVTKVIEKPAIPKSNNAIVGLYKILETKALMAALDHNIENNITSHGEFHLTDGIMRMIEQGIIFHTMEVTNWFDCGKREILLETNATLLDRGGFPTAHLDNDSNIIIPPVSLGEDCQIENSIIGPHVTVGSNTSISSSIIKESIIGNFASLQEVTLRTSVIGNDVVMKGMSQSLNIGDNTEIDLS
ncbi:MAG: sugar phosphate nucleotidyltransferase [Saprospiraceae bacterium]|nr:sugar phosphate nucleotidyltransferase [Saprospiraceae bacterium]